MASKKKIFIGDASEEVLNAIKSHPAAADYQLEVTSTGEGAFEKIEALNPDLVVLDLYLPKIHGLSILHRMQATAELQECPVIITTHYAVLQDYNMVKHAGAILSLNKPFSRDHFFKLIDDYFIGKLPNQPFHNLLVQKADACYMPKNPRSDYFLRFWGTRGSSSVSGSQYVRHGGYTSCVEIHTPDASIILDAGTGISHLCKDSPSPKDHVYHLLISHTHLDHIIGLPFFSPMHDAQAEINLWSPQSLGKSPLEPFSTLLDYPAFPIALKDMKGRLKFKELKEGVCVEINGITIWTQYAFHPGIALCYKIKVGDVTFGFSTDNEFLMGHHGDPKHMHAGHPFMKPYLPLIDFWKGCDFLVHEAQYFPEEYLSKVGWGHSSITNTSILLRETGIKEWIVTHHDPSHTDALLQQKYHLHRNILQDCQIDCRVTFAYDGFIYHF